MGRTHVSAHCSGILEGPWAHTRVRPYKNFKDNHRWFVKQTAF